MSNWSKALITVVIALVLMMNPIVRTIVVTILPLGSGIDDLIFVVLALAAGVLLLMRAVTTKDLIRKIAEWFMR